MTCCASRPACQALNDRLSQEGRCRFTFSAPNRLFFYSFAYGVFGSADRILHLAGRLLGRAVSLCLRVSSRFANGFLNCSLNLVSSTCDAILIHRLLSPSI